MPDDAIERARARELLKRAFLARSIGYVDLPPSNLVSIPCAIDALLLAFASQQAPEGWRLVPVEPTEEMWGGLARSIMMWLDFDRKTPGALVKHLEASGVEIPQWLRDEPEMKCLDHVPSKGTRCVILYRAMLDAAPSVTLGEVG